MTLGFWTGYLAIVALAFVGAYLLLCFAPPRIARAIMLADVNEWIALIAGGALIYWVVAL